jgi:hypothetical protein
MNKVKMIFPKIKKINLLLVASLIWFIAGANVINSGLKILQYQIKIFNIIWATIVFILFFKMIFSKIVKNHTIRIMGYKKDMIEIYNVFDKKSYFIMFFMISLGIVLRKLNVIQHQYLGSIYLGIGFALLSAAISFFLKYKLYFKSA